MIQTAATSDCRISSRFHCLLCIVFVVVLVSLLGHCQAMCPPACDCFPDHVWICVNITSLEDVPENHRSVVRDLSLIHVKEDLIAAGSGELRHLGTSFVSVRQLRIQQSIISSISESFVAAFPYVESVTLLDNQFQCGERMMALLKWKQKINPNHGDGHQLRCRSPDGLAGSDVLVVLEAIRRVNFECPQPCRCTLLSLQSYDSVPNLMVNCSHREMESIPDHLPESWVIELDLSHNKIADVTGLLTMPVYKSVPVLNLAHNRVHSIQVLNVSSHKNSFRLLNLINNSLTQLLPIDFIFNAKSFYYQPLVMLRNNPWHCDCHTVKTLQKIVSQNLVIIGDLPHLKCGHGISEGQSPSSVQVYRNACHSPSALAAIQYVNIACFVLIGMALIKAVYDLRSVYAMGILHWLVDVLLPSG